MTVLKIGYPSNTSMNLARGALVGVCTAGLLGLNAIGYKQGKMAADEICTDTHQTGTYANSRAALINHADARRLILESSIPLYYLEFPGIETGIAAHNKEYHKQVPQNFSRKE